MEVRLIYRFGCVIVIYITLGISLFLLFVFVLSFLSRINLLSRQMEGIEDILKESDAKIEGATRVIFGEDYTEGPRGNDQ